MEVRMKFYTAAERAAATAKETPRRRRFLGTMLRTKTRKIVAGIGVVLLASAAAFAAWTILSSGEGGSRTGSLAAPTVTAVYSGAAFPGDTVDVVASIDNPNATDMTISSVTKTGSYTSSPNTICGAILEQDAPFTPQTGQVVAQGANPSVVLGSFVLPADFSSACQGQDISTPVDVEFATN